MRCSACYAIGLVVPFCSVEHQKLVSQTRFVGRQRWYDHRVAIDALTRVNTVHLQIWCTHKAICGRVLTESYIPPFTEGEYLNLILMENDSCCMLHCLPITIMLY
jgi:hypothetical protein